MKTKNSARILAVLAAWYAVNIPFSEILLNPLQPAW